MKIAMDKLCRMFSDALDIIEKEQLGATKNHSKRVAALCIAMADKFDFEDDEVMTLAICALFHDNSLAECPITPDIVAQNEQSMVQHCGEGQNNISWLPLFSAVCGIILYHHEKENGDGPFHKLPDEIPIEASLIAAADSVDLIYNLGDVNPDDLIGLRAKIRENAEAYSTREAVDVLLDVLHKEMLENLRDENISNTLDEMLPKWEVNVWEPDVLDISNFFAHVIDSRGHIFGNQTFCSHSAQIADRAWIMANHYNYRPEERSALYLAAALHDLGKMAVPAFSSEESHLPSQEELLATKNHSQITYEWLSTVPGLELITSWASNHHEKLDGSGYPNGKRGDELDFNSRLIACLCIYQSISEKCPHHGARNHEEVMSVMFSMAKKGLIDEKITQDIDDFMEVYSLRDVPSPGVWQ